jgi:hypothetical protein
MPRQFIHTILDSNGQTTWPEKDAAPVGQRVVSRGAAYIVTDILAGNTDVKVNPFWGAWAIYNGKVRRPAAYKTGTTSDNKDVAAYGFLAPPADKKAVALAVGVWMGNSNSDPNDGKLSLDTSAPLWSAILREISRGKPIAQFKPPATGIDTAEVDAFTGLLPGPFTKKTVTEYFLPGTVPTQKESLRTAAAIDAASGLLWRDGCEGPKVTKGFFNLADVEANFPSWQRADAAWAARAARGPGVGGGLKGSITSYFYQNGFTPFGRTWGAPFMPRAQCPLFVPPPPCGITVVPPSPDPSAPPPPTCVPTPPPSGGPGGGGGGGGFHHTPKPSPIPKP